MASPSAPKQQNTKRTPAASATAVRVKPHTAAARSRIHQRRRQQMRRRMHHFEALLPRLPGARRIELHNPLPHVALRPLWDALRSRVLWIVIVVVAAVSGLVAWTSLDERWYVYREDVHFNGLNYLNAEDLWETSAVDGWQIFWIDGDAVRDRLLQNHYVADAQVHITTLLTKMTVDVTEVRPVALWETDDGVRWLRDDGIALEPRGQTPPGLLLIHDPPADATLAGAPNGAAIDPAVLASAQALASRLPGVTPLRYNALVGLNFRLPDTPYWVYWGDGDEIERKLDNMVAAETLLNDGRAEGSVIDVRFERPYIK
jgi:cell division protein FtsQ